MNYKIVNKTLFICDSWGNLGRRISDNVSFGTFDEKTSSFLVTKTDGKLEIKDIQGNLQRVVFTDVYEARFQSQDIIVRKKDGKTCLIDRYGNLKRYL